MADKRERREEKPIGPAYPARYARLGRVRFDTPLRRVILVLGLFVIALLVVLSLVAS